MAPGQFTFQNLLVALKSLQHVAPQTLKGFIGGGKESVMTRLTQLLHQTGILHNFLKIPKRIVSTQVYKTNFFPQIQTFKCSSHLQHIPCHNLVFKPTRPGESSLKRISVPLWSVLTLRVVRSSSTSMTSWIVLPTALMTRSITWTTPFVATWLP